MNTPIKPKVYVMTVIPFGEKPAGTITTIALQETAELCTTSHPVAIKTITRNIYVDDILDSVEDLTSAEKLTRDVDEIPSRGSFKIKSWTIVARDQMNVGGYGTKEDLNACNVNSKEPNVGSSLGVQNVLEMN